jgi:hypothetical protein
MKPPPKTQKCFNCNEEGHYSNNCPHPQKPREYARAARTSAGDDETNDDEGEEEEGRDAQSNSHSENDQSSTLGATYNELDNDHVIEVSAGDFYEGAIADPEFIASLHVFPLKGMNTKLGD